MVTRALARKLKIVATKKLKALCQLRTPRSQYITHSGAEGVSGELQGEGMADQQLAELFHSGLSEAAEEHQDLLGQGW